VFDFHARLPPRPAALATLLSTMDSCGIDRAVLVAGGVVDLDRLSTQIMTGGQVRNSADNEHVRAACEGSNGRLMPFYFANPYAGAGEYRRQAARFRGVELSPAVYGIGFDDARTRALVEVAAEARHPVYTVCLGRTGSRTADLVRLAAAYPDVCFVFGHAGLIAIDTGALNEIKPQDNIVVETSGCLGVVVRAAIDRLGPERVLFGTEHPLQHPSVELAKYAALDLDPPTWRAVAWGNAHRIVDEETP
jgi:predicted TIM-barrel fold metal-dependent hydrolase